MSHSVLSVVVSLVLYEACDTKLVFGFQEDPYNTQAGYDGYLGLELDPEVQAVVVGYDPYINYVKVTKAASYAQRPGSHFLCTNLDAVLPTKGEIRIPGKRADNSQQLCLAQTQAYSFILPSSHQ